LAVGVLPDPDGAADEAGRIGLGFEGIVGDEGGLVFVGAVIAPRNPSIDVTRERRRFFGSVLWKTKAWTWRRRGSRRRLRAQWMKSANSSSVVSLATVRRMRARSRGL
jgi:hypothetical protein